MLLNYLCSFYETYTQTIMNRSAWLISVVTILWFFASVTVYLCKIKNTCPPAITPIFQKIVKPAESAFTTSTGPIAFKWNSASPILNNSYDSSMQELISRMGENDTLLIIGKYYRGETGIELAKNRSKNVLKSTMMFVDSSRIKTEASIDIYGNPNKNTIFDAIQFQLIPQLNNSIVESTSNKPQIEVDNKPSTSVDGVVEILFVNQTSKTVSALNQNAALQGLIQQLKDNPDMKLKVIGFTNDGSQAVDYQLARQRAWWVKKYVWDQGIEPMRILTDAKSISDESGISEEKTQSVRVKIISSNQDN